MKYVNLHIFFFMAHLYNIQMSAASTKHRLKVMDYDIDGFVSQLFASKRFVEMVDHLSEEAANRINYNYNNNSFIVSSDIHEAPVYNENRRSKGKKYDIDGFITQVLVSKNIHKLLAKLIVNAIRKTKRFNENSGLRTRTESSNENAPKTNQGNNAKRRKELTGNIDIQVIINEMLSLSKNLQRKYDDDESDTNTKVQSKEETTESVHKDYISRTEENASKYNVTETNKNDSKKKTIDLNKHSRDDAKGHRKARLSRSDHTGTDGEDQKNSKRNINSLEEQGSSQEYENPREAQNSELKGIVKQKTSHMDKRIREKENLSRLDEENHNPPPSEEKTNREVEEIIEDTENRSTHENIIVNVGREDSVNNKMVSDEHPYDEIYNSKGSVDSGGPERSLEDQRSKEKLDEGKVKPIIRKEGGKQYMNVQDADYEEYNEKMAKWRETHPENAQIL